MTINELILGWAFWLMIIASLTVMLWFPAIERFHLEEIKDTTDDEDPNQLD